jgi:hypothetical protein
LKVVGIGGRIILKLILEKWGLKVLLGSGSSRDGPVVDL